MSDFSNLKLVDPTDARAKLKGITDARETMSTLKRNLEEAKDIYENMDGVGVLGSEVASTLDPIIPIVSDIALSLEAMGANIEAACASAEAQLDYRNNR